MSSLSITHNASLKTMKREIQMLENFCAAQYLCEGGNWQTQTAALKGPSNFAKAKFFVERFRTLEKIPTKDEVVMLALRACHNRLFDVAVRIDMGD